MRILLKEYKGKPYVWKEATYKDEFYFIDDDARIYETQIAAVQEHPAAGMVICNNCGALIENTREAIEAHYKERENGKNCVKCEYHGFDQNAVVEKEELTLIGNNTYKVSREFTSELYCQQSWYRRKVTSADAIRNCIYMRCRNSGMRSPRGLFASKPDVFSSAITVDILKEKKLTYVEHDGNYFLYDMKSRGTIRACVNNSGIVECFRISSRGNSTYFYYSEKYDKLYYEDGGFYAEGCPNWFRREKYNEALDKIRALYEGAEKK